MIDETLDDFGPTNSPFGILNLKLKIAFNSLIS